MDTFLIQPIINFLQNSSSEMVSVWLFVCCSFSILILLKYFGKEGLYLFNIVAVLASNIQVLRVVEFQWCSEPVALGTVVFASTYLCSDILTEHYGKQAAKRGVWYCFAAQVLMTALMVIAVGYPSHPEGKVMEGAMALLFTPSPRLLVASLLAFAVSHFSEIWVFQHIQKRMQGKWLWLRTNIATMFSALVDTILFSTLAWVILSPTPVTLSTLIFTYILSTFITRCIISILSTPIIYLSYNCKPIDSKVSYA